MLRIFFGNSSSSTDLAVDVSDAVSVAEAVTPLVTSFVSVFDSAAAAEAVTPLLVSLISVFDSATVAETVTLRPSVGISVFDSAAIAESVTVSLPSGGGVATFTTPGADTWTVPAGITTVTVEVWGSGAGGGSGGSGVGGGGGGGGEYTRTDSYSVTPSDVLNLSVGAGGAAGTAGNNSWFVAAVTGPNADGGSPGLADGTAGTGGSSSGGVGDHKFSGGDGGTGGFLSQGGGGGSSAGTAAAGNPGTGPTGGTAPTGGGNGGNGSFGSGGNGSAPGGAGAGSVNSTGGTGAAGKIVLTFPAGGGGGGAPGPVSVNDAITVSESSTVLLVSFVSVEDDAKADASAAGSTVLGVDLTGIVNDTVTVLDVPNGSPSVAVSVNDAVTVADVPTVAPANVISTFDSVAVADVPTVALFAFVSVFDSVTVADVPTETLVSFVSVSDNVAAADVPTALLVSLPSVFDAVAVTESVTSVVSTPRVTTSDAVTVTDVPSSSPVNLINKNDTVTVADVVVTELVHLPVVNDSAAVTESTNVHVDLNVVVEELVTTQEGVFADTGTVTTRFPEAHDDVVVDEAVTVIAVSHPPPVFIANGRDPIGVCQPPGTGLNYPFVAPSANVENLFADFYLACEGFTPPFTLAYAIGFGSEETTPPPPGMPTVPVHGYDVVVTDANGQVAFDSTTATHFGTLDWAGRLRVLEWTTDEAVCRAVIHIAWGPEDTPVEYEYYLTPTDGTLDPRTCEVLAGRVRSMRVAARALNGLTGTVKLKNGFNTTITTTPAVAGDGTRHVSTVTIAAVPGTGLGRKPGCTTTPPVVRRINQVSPTDAGIFLIELDPCLRGQRPLAIVNGADEDRAAVYRAAGLTDEQAGSALLYDSDCQPCCTCDDFVRTYRGLQVLYDQWRLVADTATAVRDLYADNRQRWLDQAALRAGAASAIVVQAEPNCRVFVGGSYCNFSTCCLVPVETRYTFQLYQDGVEVPWPGATLITAAARDAGTCNRDAPAVPDEVGPVFRFYHDALDPQKTVVSQLRLCLPCLAGDAVKVTMTTHTPDPTPPETGSCDIPVATIPAAIQAIWTAHSVTGDTPRGVAVLLRPLDPTTPVPTPGC
jgi:hypothetical protein